jgi:hypothetical protein
MLVDLMLIALCSALAGLAVLARRQRDAAVREAGRSERLARIGATVEGLAHDLNNLFTSIPYLLEEAHEVEDEERRSIARDELENALDAAAKLLQELHGYVHGPTGSVGSIEGVVRLGVAGLRYRGPKIVTRFVADMPYGPEDLEMIERIRELMTRAVEEAKAFEGSVVHVELSEDRLVIEYPARHSAETSKGVDATLDPLASNRCKGWSVHRRIRREGAGRAVVRLELERTG